MTINVVSNVAGSIGMLAAGPASLASAGSGVALDFAALLSGQTLASTLASSQGSIPNLSGKAESTGMLAEEAETTSDSILDPSLIAAMIGFPPAQAPSIQTPGTSRAASSEEDGATSRNIISGLTERRLGKPDAEDHSAPGKGNTGLLSALQETPAQTASAGEAANIAVDTTETNSAGSFQIAMNHAAQQHEKVTQKQPSISQPLSSDAWPAQFGEKIVWLAKNDQQSAQININPPQLGPIQITLQLNGDQANAIFASPHAEVRQAIESAMPQLREMLASAGISLGDANVGANLAQQRQDNPFQSANKNQSGDENAILPANEKVASTGASRGLHGGRGLVDLFA